MKLKWIVVLFVLSGISVFGFSPYENYLRSGQQTHVALLAAAKDGQESAVLTALANLNGKKVGKAFKKVKISNISAYSKKLQGQTWVMIYFDYDGKNYLDAAKAFQSVSCAQKLEPFITPHPRAKQHGSNWLQLEWINYISASQKTGAPTDRFAMSTRIKPEKEQEYRTLHQTVWPGVTDQMVRGNFRNFSIFLVEIGDELFEFFYVEYVGTDSKKDGEMNSADLCNQRWWKLTDPCQNPLPDADDIWSPMDKI
jgi:L-rhamnose mutarotase